jgi:HAD superfamily hydrolase (TIGR01509 family)
MTVAAVVFDLDGVLLDSEQLWDRARREIAAEHAGAWTEGATEAMQGMSSPEWAAYMQHQLQVDLPAEEIRHVVAERLLMYYEHQLPLMPGTVDAVGRLAGRWPLGLASSSNREVIEAVLRLAALAERFQVIVSSEEVARGKPAPDVYLEAARLLGVLPSDCVAVEDSANGIRAGVAAGMTVIATPNPHFPPPPEVLDLARAVLPDLHGLTVESVLTAGEGERRLDEEEFESFPASDPHSDWAGP